MQVFASFISYLFHPLFVNFYCCLLAIFFHPSLQGRVGLFHTFQVSMLFFITLIIIPMLCIYTFIKSGYVSSWKMPDRKERMMPFFFIAIMLGISAFKTWDGPFEFCTKLILCAAIALFCNSLLLFFTKASVHTMAMVGGATAFLKEGINWNNNLMIFIAALLFFFAGITASSRLILKAHTISEILYGAIIGILVILPII